MLARPTRPANAISRRGRGQGPGARAEDSVTRSGITDPGSPGQVPAEPGHPPFTGETGTGRARVLRRA